MFKSIFSLVIPKGKVTLFGGKGKELVRNISFNIQENKKLKLVKFA